MTAAMCSVVIPCHNHARFLDSAIRSALDQHDVTVQVIVVDDGSTDNTSEVAAAHGGVRLIRQPNRGLSEARNAGLRVSASSSIVFLDADDVLLPDAVGTGLGYLAQRPDAPLAAGRSILIDRDGAELSAHWAPPVTSGHYRTLLTTNFIWTPGATVMRRSAVLAAGGFLRDHAAAADYALYLRLARLGPFACHDRYVVMYRQHGDNMSQNAVEMLRATLGVLDAERPFVPRELAGEFRGGVRAWKDYYGDQIVNGLRRSVHEVRDPARAARLALALLRYHPRGFFRHLGRKLAVSSGFRQAGRYPIAKSRDRSAGLPAGSEGGKRTERSSASR